MGIFTKKSVPVDNHQELLAQITWVSSSVAKPADQELGWEYLFLASEIERCLGEALPKYQSMMSATIFSSSSGDPIGDIREAMDAMGTSIGFVPLIFDSKNIEKGFGAPGTPGSEVDMTRIACEITGVYVNLINIAKDLKTTDFGKFQSVATDIADSCLTPLKEIRDFSSEMSSSFKKVIAEVRKGEVPSEPLTLQLKITMDDAILERITNHLNSLK